MPYKCKIAWIDANGKATPDDNDAVAIALFHRPVYAQYTGKITEYSSLIEESFPICAEHRKQVTADMLFPRGGWAFVPIPENDANVCGVTGTEEHAADCRYLGNDAWNCGKIDNAS